jgi:hypothetical protein
MSRPAAALLAALATLTLAAAGCGTSPEDKARSDGKDVGAALQDLRTASSREQAADALQRARAGFADIRGDLPAEVAGQLQAIGDELKDQLANADDAAARRSAYLSALTELNAVASDRDSVVNEFRRGVREGYEDAG